MIVICVLCVNKRVSDRERNITNTVHGYTVHDRYMCTVCEQEGE